MFATVLTISGVDVSSTGAACCTAMHFAQQKTLRKAVARDLVLSSM